MKIGIILYSQTGNTLSVGEQLQTALTDRGHEAQIQQITVEKADSAPLQLTVIPETQDYDMVIYGAPIQAFSLCAPMTTYLRDHVEMTGKDYHCFVTQQFRRPWLGGSRGIRQMQALCDAKGGNAKESAIVHWSADDRDDQIQQAVKTLTNV